MAINASMQWWIRQSGNALNGGGFDSAVTNAGTNYADQDAPQLSLTDLATSAANSTTLTSATGGFTAAMIGNVIRIASGTNFTAGYYVVTAYTDTNTVTLDRTPSPANAGSSGVGRLGGAFPTPWSNLPTSGPTIASPLAAGHTVNLRGSGSTNPTTPDYVQSTTYFSFVSGTMTAGYVYWIGYNGRPMWQTQGLGIYATHLNSFDNIYFQANGLSNQSSGMINGLSHFYNCWFDQKNYDIAALNLCGHVIGCRFFSSTTITTAGNYPAINSMGAYGGTVAGCTFDGCKGGAISIGGASGQLKNSLIVNCKSTDYAVLVPAGGSPIFCSIFGNTIANNAGDGIKITSSQAITLTAIYNNVISGNGGYGKRISVNTTDLNSRISRRFCGYNNYYNNALGAVLNCNIEPTDLTLDPQFANPSSGDFSVGQNMKGIAFPNSFTGTGTANYADLGAAQAIASGGGGLLLPRAMNGGYSA